MSFSEYVRKRKQKEQDERENQSSSASGAPGETAPSASQYNVSQDDAPKSFSEYVRKRKGAANWRDEERATSATTRNAAAGTQQGQYGTMSYAARAARRSELENQLKEAEKELSRANALKIGFQRGMTGQSASGQAEMARRREENEENIRALQQEIARLKGQIDEDAKAAPVYDTATVQNYQKELEAAEAALTSKWATSDAFTAEAETRQEALRKMESDLTAKIGQLESTPSETLYNQVQQEYAQYEQALAEYNSMVSEYAALADAYNAKAGEYSGYMNLAKSDASGWEIAKRAGIAGLGQFNKAIGSTLDFLLPTELLGEKYDFASWINNYYSQQAEAQQQRLQEATYGRGWGTELGANLMQNTVATLPNTILAFMSGGSSVGAQGASAALQGASTAAAGNSLTSTLTAMARQMASNPLFWTSFIQTAGTDYEEAKAEGASELAAVSSAFLSSLLNAGVEVGGGLETLPGELRSGNRSAIRQWVSSALEEGNEEAVQGVISGLTKKLVYAHDKDMFSMTDEDAVINPGRMLEEYGMGAAVGGILGGSQVAAASAANAASNTLATNTAQKKIGTEFSGMGEDVVQAVIESGLESDPKSQSYKLAAKLQEKLNRGESVTAKEIGKLYQANVEAVNAEEKASLEQASDEAGAPAEGDRAPTDGILRSTQNDRVGQNGASTDGVLRSAQDDRVGVQDFAEKYGYGEHGRSTLNDMIERRSVSPDAVNQEFHLPYLWGMSNRARTEVELTSPIQEEAFNAGRLDRIMSMKRSADTVTVWGKKSGLVENDLTKKLPRQTRESLHAIGSALGTKIIMEHIPAERNANGYYRSSDGTIHIDANTTDPVMTVAKHEITHRMQELAPEAYTLFRDYAVQMENRGAEFGNLSAVEIKQEQYRKGSGGTVSLDVEAAMDEIAANFTERILTDEKALHDFVTDMSQTEEKRSIGQKFFDAVHAFLQKIKEHFGKGKNAKAKMDAEAEKAFGATVSELERAEKLWKKAYSDAVQAAESKAGQTQKNTAQTDGEVQYSLDAGFSKNLDEWIKSGKKGGGYFRIGTTSEALQSIGVKDYEIFWDKTKIAAIMSKHPEMTQSIIAQVPQILENPVMVLQSNTVTNRVMVFGELKTADGSPVMVALELRPQNKHGEIMDFAKVASAYGRTQVQHDINTSDILYLDPNKNRTDTWAEALRLQLPAGLPKYGSIGMITYVHKDVNGVVSSGEGSGKTAMQAALEKAQKAKGKSVKFSLKDSTSENPDGGKSLYGIRPDGTIRAAGRARRLNEVKREKRGAVRAAVEALRTGRSGEVQHAWKEMSASDFIHRMNGRGLTMDSVGEQIISYRPLAEADATEDMRRTQARFEALGYTVYMTEDGYSVWSAERAQEELDACAVSPAAGVAILNGRMMRSAADVDNMYAHEELHTALSWHPELADEFVRVFWENVDTQSEAFRRLLKRICRMYDDGRSVDAVTDTVLEELMTFYAGAVETDVQGIAELYQNAMKNHATVQNALAGLQETFREEIQNERYLSASQNTGGDQKTSRGVGEIQGAYGRDDAGGAERILRRAGEEDAADPDSGLSGPGRGIEGTLRFSLKGQKDLERENAKLRETVAGLREQFRRTKFAKVDRKALDVFTKTLLKDYQSSADVEETRAALDGLYTYLANGENGEGPVWSEAYRRAFETAAGILESASVLEDEVYREYSRLRRYLRDHKLHVPREMWSDLDGMGGYNALRRAYMGRLSLSSTEGTGIDQVYQELSYMYPEFFDEAETSNPADQLMRIAEVLDGLQPYEVNPYSTNMRESASWLANDILERFYELPQAKPTFADKAEGRLTGQVIKDAKKLEKLRGQKNARIAQLIAENRQKVKQAQAKERGKRMEAVREVKEHYRAKEARASESRRAQVLRAKITRHANELSRKLLRPNDKQHVPEELRGPVAAVLEAINQESDYTYDPETMHTVVRKDGKKGGMTGKHMSAGDPKGVVTKRTEAFRSLKEQYAKIAADPEADMVIDPSLLGSDADGVKGNFDKVISMKDTRLADMSSSELQTVWEVIRAVEHSVTTAGKVLSKAKYERTAEWADAIAKDTESRKTKNSLTKNHVLLDMEEAYTFFSHFGDSGKAIYRMLRNAQDKERLIQNAIESAAKNVASPKTVKDLKKSHRTFETTRGEKLTLSADQVMDLYLLSKRKKARDHLLGGGIVQPEVEGTRIRRGTYAILLTEEDLAKITSSLTDEQRKIADALQKLTTGLLADYGNEASMAAYGYKKFTEADYWPIKSAREGIYSTAENGANNARSIKNIGMAQSTMPNANNQLDIRGVFTTFANHAADMQKYAAYLTAMEDANRLYNFKFRDADGNRTGMNIKGILDRVAGTGAQAYWNNLMEDIQNGINSPGDSALWNIVGKQMGNFKAAAVSANLRVFIQQPSAIMRANAVMNPLDIGRGLRKGVTKGNGWEKALKYSPIAMRKDAGGFDISNPLQMEETLFDGRETTRKITDALSSPAGKLDALTWGRIWNAAEWQVAREQPYIEQGSEEFYEAVNEVFTDVIDQTQVVDGVLQRSQIMRSSNEVAKQATSFMGEPIKAFNMLIRAVDQFRYETDAKKRTALRKALGRTVTALIATNVLNSFLQSIVDGFRDDDEDKTYWERVMSAFTGLNGDEENAFDNAIAIMFGGNIGDSMNVVGQIPFAKDVWSMIKGYEVKRTDMQIFSDIVNAAKTFNDSVFGDGKKTIAYATKELVAAGAKLFGLPASNIFREIESMARTIVDATGSAPARFEMEKAIYKVTNKGNRSRYVSILFDALKQGDIESYKRMRAELMNKMGMDGKEIDSDLRSRLKKAQKDDPEFKIGQEAMDIIGKLETGTAPKETEKKFSGADLDAKDYDRFADMRAEDYRDLADDIDDLPIFDGMTQEEKGNVLDAAYGYAETMNLLEVTGGIVSYEKDPVTDEEKAVITVDGVKHPFDMPKWMGLATTADEDLGLSVAEYIALKEEYSAATMASDRVYEAYDAGLDVEMYLEFNDATKDFKADKDENGKAISGSKKEKILDYMDTMGLSDEEYEALLEVMGYKSGSSTGGIFGGGSVFGN